MGCCARGVLTATIASGGSRKNGAALCASGLDKERDKCAVAYGVLSAAMASGGHKSGRLGAQAG
jgi:hypothetical protein